MGTSASKSVNTERDDVPESKLSSTPIQAPQFRKLDIDPRSPSSDIARTPIEVLKTPLVQNTINSVDNSMKAAPVEPHFSDTLDPRSPTTEFHRTPIVTEAILKPQSTLHNKNLDNARMPIVALTPSKPRKMPERVSRKIYGSPEPDAVKVIPPKLLESSPIEVRPTENKRNSVVGLLETNIDFFETDLDEVIQSRRLKMAESLSSSNISSDGEFVAAAEYSTSFKNDSQEVNENDLQEVDDENDLQEVDDESDLQEVAENNLQAVNDGNDLQECNTSSINELSNQSEHNEVEAIMNILYDSPEPCSPVNKNDMLLDTPKAKIATAIAVEPKNMITVEELDRKLTNLIYEDKELESSPRIVKVVGAQRTPLGDRNSNSQQRKAIPRLKVSDKPTKPTTSASKIPVFKEKRLKGKANVQCENTPPRIMAKRSQWSAEDSLLI